MLEKLLSCLKFVQTTLIYLIYPPVCPICREIGDEYNQLCETCATKILKPDLAKFLPNSLSGVLRITLYHSGTRPILRKLKFDNNLNVLPAIHSILATVANRDEIKNFIVNIDVATFVPLHADRLRERGYNQVEEIFSDWLIAQGLTVEHLLIRSKFTPRLFNYSLNERRDILKGAFNMVENVDVTGKNILIVDDIYTTGATVSECARVLKSSGAAKIYVMAFASDSGDFDNARSVDS